MEIAVFAFVPSLRDVHRIQIVPEAARFVLELCDGARTGEQIADACADAGLDAEEALDLLRRWISERAMVLQ